MDKDSAPTVDDSDSFRERVEQVVKQPGKGNFGGLKPMKKRREKPE